MRTITFRQTWALFAYDGNLENEFWCVFDQTAWLYNQGYEPIRVVERDLYNEVLHINLTYEVSDEDATFFLLQFPQDEEPTEVELQHNEDTMISEITRTHYEQRR